MRAPDALAPYTRSGQSAAQANAGRTGSATNGA
jgi:hypothetical protein